MIDAGETDIEKISDAIHKGWNVTARAFVKNPDQFDDTEKLRAAGKLEAKLQQRAKLMTINYGQLPNEEQEKDRVVARALLQAINNQEDNDQDVAEAGSLAQQAAIAINMKKHHKKPTGVAEGDDDIASAKERLAQLEKQFDHSYEYSDDHREWRKHRDIYLEIQRLKKLISQNEPSVSEDWQNVNKRDKTDGMSSKAVKAYRRENPGSKLKTAVTTKPSKLKKGSKSAKRRKSFCARMSGMKRAHASAKTKRDPNSPINKALRRWNCESVEDMKKLLMIAEQKIAKLKSQPNKV